MPKKKKTCSLRRPSLQFAPSPDQHQPPVITPEFAVQNPITAKSIQVNDQSFNTWVSPQFRFNAEMKQKRARHPSHVTQSLQKTKSFNETRVTRERNRRYKQLQFINKAENSINEQTPCKDKNSKITKAKDRKSHLDKTVSPGNVERENIEVNTPEFLHSREHNCPNTKDTKEYCNEHSDSKSRELLADKTHVHLYGSNSSIGRCGIADNMFVNASLTPSKSRPTVLAPDTPELEYGLPLRQIQLKYGLRDRV